MDKIPVVLVALDVQKLERALRLLNYDNVLLAAIITENPAGNIGTFTFGNLKVPIFPFSHIQKILVQAKNGAWLINGFVNGVSDIYKVKKFLVANGVPEDHIVNFEVEFHVNQTWVANVHYIEKYPVDFFATGISYVEAGLNFRVILGGGGTKA